MSQLSISVVTYHPNAKMLTDTLKTLGDAVAYARQHGVLRGADLCLVDNGDDRGLLEELGGVWQEPKHLISGQGNVGFGRGHNLALAHHTGDFHLILNPDVYIEQEAISKALSFLQAHPDCALLSPLIVDEGQAPHYLCKRYPSVFDLFLRGFMPETVRKIFHRRMDAYELNDKNDEPVLWNPPIVSGCFMLFRSEVLKRLKGFDPDYFLYFEDFDLSLRAGKTCQIAAVGEVRIAHFGGGASRKGWRHVVMFCSSARKFFSKHGWKFW